MQRIFSLVFLLLVLGASLPSDASESVSSDPRIRTLIYGENDVFRVNATFGYQTVVEFQEDERIQTISIGNPNIFKIIPSKNRLFIRAFQNGQHTNMTLITSKRMYQFELTSNADIQEEIMYLVKFIYPGEEEVKSASTSAGPMNIYSPISIGSSGRSIDMDMPSMPSPSLDANIQADEAPLSMQFRSQGERKGFKQSPIVLDTPKIY